VVFEHITPTSNPVVADVSILPATGGSPGPYTRTGLALLGVGAGLAFIGSRKPKPRSRRLRR
jgi:hypothetical protein